MIIIFALLLIISKQKVKDFNSMDNRIKELLTRLKQDTSTQEGQTSFQEQDIKQIWDLSRQYKQQATPKFATEKNLSQLQQRIKAEQQGPNRSNKIRRLGILRIAAAIAFLLVASWIINNQFATEDQWQWAENTGTENQIILLQDGSEVQLFPGAKLGYSKSFKGQEERAVSLSGAAHFDVSSNPDQPFIIETNNTQVKVLGTQFILAEADNLQETTVTVEEGKVAFTDKSTGEMVQVTANEIGVCQKGGILFQDKTQIPEGPQIVQLRTETIANLVAQLSRRQNWTITFDNGLKTCEITGTFDLNQPEKTLAKIKELTGHQVERKATNHYIIQGPCK